MNGRFAHGCSKEERQTEPLLLSALKPKNHTTSNIETDTATDGTLLDLRTLIVVIGLSMTLSCGTSHAVLDFTAPLSSSAGTPFTVTVTVMINGERDTIINSSIHFTSSDPAAILPPDYGFSPQDAGSHTWVGGFVLMTPGSQSISGSIFDAEGINGTATVTVSP